MKRAGLIVASLFYLCANLLGQSTRDLLLNNHNVQAFASNATTKKPMIKKDEDLTINNFRNYDYVLEPEEGKSYKDYQVIKLDELDDQSLVIGLLTHTLDRETRYIEIDRYNGMLTQILEGDANYVFVYPGDKQFFMTKDGEFKYLDGRELVGSKEVVAYLEKGKPITEATFYYELKSRGLIENKAMNLRTFISLSLEEKIRLLGMDLYASNN